MNQQVIEAMVRKMAITPKDNLVEIGCGHGALLEHISVGYDCKGIGIDIDEIGIKIAQKNLEAINSRILLKCQRYSPDLFEEGTFTHAACIGSSGAFGEGKKAFPAALCEIQKLLTDGGIALFGELYWKSKPPLAYQKATGIEEKSIINFGELLKAIEKRKFQLLSLVRASEQDWDMFESNHLYNRVKAGKEMLARKWFDSYLKWGRNCMGFALFLVRKQA